MKSLSLPRLLSLTVMGFALGLVSATLEPALLGYKILELNPERRNTLLGFTTFVGLVVAGLTQPVMGALSDRTRTRWGRRLPFMFSGAIGLIVTLVWIAAAPTFALLLSGVVLLQIASNTVQGPWQALVPDQVPDQQRGLASGMKLLWEGMAAVVGRVIAGYLIGLTPVWGRAAISATIAVPAIGLIGALVITARGSRPAISDNPIGPRRSIGSALTRTFLVDLRAYPAFGWWFLNRLFFWCAMIAVSIFLLFFAIDVVGLTEAEAQRYIALASAVLGVALLVCAVPASRLADRVPRKPLVFAAGLIACAGTVVVLITRELVVMLIGGALIGAGTGVYLITSWALITEIVPRAEAARYLGMANMAAAIGSASARLIGGALIDGVNAAHASTSIGYLTVYGLAAGLFFLSAMAVLPLRTPGNLKSDQPRP
jgi:MFS family permease